MDGVPFNTELPLSIVAMTTREVGPIGTFETLIGAPSIDASFMVGTPSQVRDVVLSIATIQGRNISLRVQWSPPLRDGNAPIIGSRIWSTHGIPTQNTSVPFVQGGPYFEDHQFSSTITNVNINARLGFPICVAVASVNQIGEGAWYVPPHECIVTIDISTHVFLSLFVHISVGPRK